MQGRTWRDNGLKPPGVADTRRNWYLGVRTGIPKDAGRYRTDPGERPQVPFIVFAPSRIPQGIVIRTLLGQYDFMPTLPDDAAGAFKEPETTRFARTAEAK